MTVQQMFTLHESFALFHLLPGWILGCSASRNPQIISYLFPVAECTGNPPATEAAPLYWLLQQHARTAKTH